MYNQAALKTRPSKQFAIIPPQNLLSCCLKREIALLKGIKSRLGLRHEFFYRKLYHLKITFQTADRLKPSNTNQKADINSKRIFK